MPSGASEVRNYLNPEHETVLWRVAVALRGDRGPHLVLVNTELVYWSEWPSLTGETEGRNPCTGMPASAKHPVAVTVPSDGGS
ncbi:hypothetical protein GCM10022232_58840 [Streptomyces plumbiresistens]|uniref:Uncharacterized protein n=1 Tax=Streptomyces plumbiresistens TaxID=511811 RepID=A0ABP7SDA8_9ACTN